jgi:hypothetical protein
MGAKHTAVSRDEALPDVASGGYRKGLLQSLPV